MAGRAWKQPRADAGLTELDATTLACVVAEGKATTHATLT